MENACRKSSVLESHGCFMSTIVSCGEDVAPTIAEVSGMRAAAHEDLNEVGNINEIIEKSDTSDNRSPPNTAMSDHYIPSDPMKQLYLETVSKFIEKVEKSVTKDEDIAHISSMSINQDTRPIQDAYVTRMNLIYSSEQSANSDNEEIEEEQNTSTTSSKSTNNNNVTNKSISATPHHHAKKQRNFPQ